jgi:hypothetical protein
MPAISFPHCKPDYAALHARPADFDEDESSRSFATSCQNAACEPIENGRSPCCLHCLMRDSGPNQLASFIGRTRHFAARPLAPLALCTQRERGWG